MSDRFNPHRSDIPRIIGLAGRAGAGKTTAAEVLERAYGYHLASFATPLKKAAKLMYDLSYEQLYNPAEKDKVDERYGLSPRTILQRLGTEVCREVHPLTWTLAMEREINPTCSYVIDDVRFPNEVEAIHRWGGVVWHIEGKESKDVDASRVSENPLQGQLRSGDAGIDNSGTLGMLASTIKLLIEGSR